MHSLSNDKELQRLMREFLMGCNRVDNAEGRGAGYAELDALHNDRRRLAGEVERALVERGWTRPGVEQVTTLDTALTLPETPAIRPAI